MNPSLAANRTELQQAIKMLAKFVRAKKHGKRMVVSFSDGAVMFEAGGISARAAAEGVWPGKARIESGFVLGLRGALPEDELVPIRVEQGRLRIANFSTPCTWQDSVCPSIQLPLNATLAQILSLRSTHSPEEIEQSGLLDALQAAERRRDSLLRQAAWILEPLGVGADDLHKLVDECIHTPQEV